MGRGRGLIYEGIIDAVLESREAIIVYAAGLMGIYFNKTKNLRKNILTHYCPACFNVTYYFI